MKELYEVELNASRDGPNPKKTQKRGTKKHVESEDALEIEHGKKSKQRDPVPSLSFENVMPDPQLNHCED